MHLLSIATQDMLLDFAQYNGSLEKPVLCNFTYVAVFSEKYFDDAVVVELFICHKDGLTSLCGMLRFFSYIVLYFAGCTYNLFAFPSECNFSGMRFHLDLVNIIKDDAEKSFEGLLDGQ